MSRTSPSLRRLLLVTVVVGAPFLAAGQRAQAQGKNTGVFLTQAVNRVTDNAALLNRARGYGFNDGFCILGAWVEAGDRVEFDLPLVAGAQYVFVGGGDKDAEDVDIEILDQNDRVLASDNRVSADAFVEFTPRSSAKYVLRLKLYKARANLPCVCVATVMKKGGHPVTLQSLDDANGRLVRELENSDRELQRKNLQLDLRKAKNQWALYGAILAPGQEISVTNMNLGTGTRACLGVGDRNTSDVDIFLLDADNRVLKEDTRTNADAAVIHQADGGRHSMRVRNYQGNGPSVCLMAVFDIFGR